jgi:undecaprenyl-diphosphatase
VTSIEIAILALVQGVTEFLPISSHAHLILARYLMGLPEGGLMIDVAVHVGTLFAVLLYFWRDVWWIVCDLLRLATGRVGPGAVLGGQLVVATIPVVVAGFLIERYVGEAMNTVAVVAWTTLVFGLVLHVVDRYSMRFRRLEHLTYGQSFFLGCAQVLALVPGVSRSGITMTAARLLGYERTEAARFSLLMSMPAIMGAGTLVGLDIYRTENPQLHADVLLAAALAFVSAFVAIALMMRWLQRATFLPFVVYRVALGILLLIWIYAQ